MKRQITMNDIFYRRDDVKFDIDKWRRDKPGIDPPFHDIAIGQNMTEKYIIWQYCYIDEEVLS